MPSYVINVATETDRLSRTVERLKAAGFTNIRRWDATDGFSDGIRDILYKINKKDIRVDMVHNRGGIGCYLSHFTLWEHVRSLDLVHGVNIFEDDIVFHDQFQELAPVFYDQTPKDWDILYMGCEVIKGVETLLNRTFCVGASKVVNTYPAYCLHAYNVSVKGMDKLIATVLNASDMVIPIDDLITRVMICPAPCITWYCWDATTCDYRDPKSGNGKVGNYGLILQDSTLPSTIAIAASSSIDFVPIDHL